MKKSHPVTSKYRSQVGTKRGDVSQFRENKYILSLCHSRFQVIWTFPNVVVQGQQRNVKYMQSCCFPQKKKTIVFQTFTLPSPSWCRKVPNDVESGALCSKNGLKMDYFLQKKKAFVFVVVVVFILSVVSLFFSHTFLTYTQGRTIRKVMGGEEEGNFPAEAIFFRYQIPCMNFFQAIV